MVRRVVVQEVALEVRQAEIEQEKMEVVVIKE